MNLKRTLNITVLTLALAAMAMAGSHGGKDIVDTAVGAGSFNTLVAAVKAAGLVDTLKREGPFTVFAPTDEAFAKLPAGTVESLLKPENKDKLVAIVTYHVVAGNVMAADVVKLSEAQTVQGVQAKAGEHDSAYGKGARLDHGHSVKQAGDRGGGHHGRRKPSVERHHCRFGQTG